MIRFQALAACIASVVLIAGDGPQSPRWVKLGPTPSEPALRIGAQKQLLVDNEILCDWYDVRRVLGKVRKHPDNPILQADRAWEKNSAQTWGVRPNAALYDSQEGVFKLWYTIFQPEDQGAGVGYATSRDGIRWEKPELNLIPFGGQKQNNLCFLQPFGTVVRGLSLIQDDRQEAPDRRYKAIGVWPVHQDGTWYACWLGIAFSADGITWHQIEGGVSQGAGGGTPACIWDEGLQRYVLFHRQLTEKAFPERKLKRYIVRQESTDLKDWSPRQTVFNPTDVNWPEAESMNVFRHEGIYFGLAYMLEIQKKGVLEVHLLTSRDGYHWNDPSPGEPFIPRGVRGDFDDMMTYGCQTIIQGEQMRFYYEGTRYSHAYPNAPIVDDGGSIDYLPGGKGRVVYRPGKIGLATLPLDRFAGLRSDEPIGAFLTKPILVEGDELYLNADVDRELRVELVNPISQLVDSGPKETWAGHYISGQEEVFAGFARSDCEVVTGDSLRHRVLWRGGPIGKFKGKAVRLRVLARMATVYGFEIK
jgi:hypothetical protein